jgi:hypothetical protein
MTASFQQEGDVNKTSLTPPLIIKVSVPGQENQ